MCVLVLFIGWVASKVWVKIQGPIDHLDEDMNNWSAEEKKMIISKAGYDLTKTVWVMKYDIPKRKANGYKPVVIGWWLCKREVHLPRKYSGEYAQLFEKP